MVVRPVSRYRVTVDDGAGGWAYGYRATLGGARQLAEAAVADGHETPTIHERTVDSDGRASGWQAVDTTEAPAR